MSNEILRKLRRQARIEKRPLIKVVEEHLDAAYFKATHPDFDCITQERSRRLVHQLVPIMSMVAQDKLQGLSLEDQVALLNRSGLDAGPANAPQIGVIPGKNRL